MTPEETIANLNKRLDSLEDTANRIRQASESMNHRLLHIRTSYKRRPFMTPEETLVKAKEILDSLGGDPQKVHLLLTVAKTVDNDPQKLMALTALASFLSGERPCR